MTPRFFTTSKPFTRFAKVEPISDYDYWLSEELARRRAERNNELRTASVDPGCPPDRGGAETEETGK